MKNINEKKVLVLTGLTEQLHSLVPVITNKKAEHVLITTSFGTMIAQPYGCTIRNILLAVYSEGVEEIYVIGEEYSSQCKVNGKEVVSNIQKAGVSKETIKTIEYIHAVGGSLAGWLEGAGNREAKKEVMETINFIKSHPLLPKKLSVRGFTVKTETGEFEAVAPEGVKIVG